MPPLADAPGALDDGRGGGSGKVFDDDIVLWYCDIMARTVIDLRDDLLFAPVA